ncbi:MAG TPA: hypothetical protein VME01_02355 [Solirubrobacteraceae bacterium]|nr:hypothetical protein [Solirubrobacteraceae bacterium]
MTWRGLDADSRRIWFRQLWDDACMLQERYELALQRDWWKRELQVEAIAALAAWVARYDSGEWDDPPGKLALLYDLERVAGLLREGPGPFYAARDRAEFERFLATEPECP